MEKQSKIVVKAIVLSVFLIILYLFLPTISGIIENPPGTMYGTIPAKLQFEFEQDISISARSFTINITIPESGEYQSVSVVDESSYPKTVHHAYNRTWWSYSLTGSANIRIRYSGETVSKYWNIRNPGTVNDIPQWLKNRYLHSEYILGFNGKKLYVIDPEPFKGITDNITAGHSNVEGKLRAIYDFIVQNFHYESERTGNPRTAIETWNAKSGDCDELSFVFVSMARSIGIPAWIEYGWLYTGDSWGQHAWIRTAIPDGGELKYVNIDLTIEVGQKDLGRGFLVRDPYRITEWVEDGSSEHLTAFYHYLTYTEPPQLHISQSIQSISIKKEGTLNIPLGNTVPSWLMALIIGVLILAVFIIIIKM